MPRHARDARGGQPGLSRTRVMSAWTFLLRNAQELKQTFSYISSIKGDKDDKTPLFIHVSVHGNDSGIGVGPDIIRWDNLAKTVQQMYARLRYYHGPIILVLSACGVNK